MMPFVTSFYFLGKKDENKIYIKKYVTVNGQVFVKFLIIAGKSKATQAVERCIRVYSLEMDSISLFVMKRL